MRKKTIGALYFIGLTFWIVSLVIFILVLATSRSQLNIGPLVAEIVIGWIGGILMMISWVGALINSARAGQWKWFLWVFFLSVFVLGVYLFRGPDPYKKAGNESVPLM